MKNLFLSIALLLAATTTHAQSTINGDLNHDGELNIIDVMMMIDIILERKPDPSFTYCPDDNHPHLIDLGLPSGTLWACCNVDATMPEEFGGFYSFGETEEKSTYTWENYIHCDGTKGTCHNLGAHIAGTQYDVATVKWGHDWLLPSPNQIKELIDNCDYVWDAHNGVKGAWLVSKINGGSIFFPATGEKRNGHHYSQGEEGYFWSDEQSQTMFNNARFLRVDNARAAVWSGDIRYSGYTVRPVAREIGSSE